MKQYLPCQVTSPTNGNKNLNNMVDNKFTNPTMHLSYLPQRTFIINPKDILWEGRKHHMNLYSDDESCNLLDRQPVRLIQEGILTSTSLPKLNKNPKSQCEGLLTESELKSIKTLKNGKKPGNDELTAESCKFFWNDIKDLLLSSINYALEYGRLSTLKRRLITPLLPIKDKDLLYLKIGDIYHSLMLIIRSTPKH